MHIPQFGFRLFDAAVHFFAVSHSYYENEQSFVSNLINGAVVLSGAQMDAKELLARFQPLRPTRTRILFQEEKVPDHFLSDVRIEPAEVPPGGGGNFNAVGQDSVSQFPHEVPERDCSLFFRLLQGSAGLFQIDSVPFLPGQALQEPEVIHRDDGGQILAATGDNRPLLPVGGAVHDFGELFARFRDIEACHLFLPYSYELYKSITSIGQGWRVLQGLENAGALWSRQWDAIG